MSMTFTNAQSYVARILGNSGNTNETTVVAADAIKAAVQEWNLRHDWRYLLMNTGNTIAVPNSTIAVDGITVTTTTTNGFAGANINQTVTGTGIPANTKIASVTSATVIVLDTASTPATVTVTLGADIPVRPNITTYNMPSPIKRPHSARLQTNEREILYKEEREIKRQFADLNSGGTPIWYNMFNSVTFDSTTQNGKLRLFPTPTETESVRIWYYRPISEPSSGSDVLDTLDRYVYALLEMARAYYLKGKDADNPRTTLTWQNAEKLLSKCIADDEQATEDRDIAMIPLMEWGFHRQVETDDVIFGGSL